MKVPKNTSNTKSSTLPKKKELSVRESEVLELLLKGFSNKDIASFLFISPFTAKRHIENIYRKLQVHNRIELFQKTKQNKPI